MKISALQQARYLYAPKLPKILREDIQKLDVVIGQPTQSASDQEELKNLFPNTYGLPKVSFKVSGSAKAGRKLNVGVILSGG